jgi:REP element-mobilizing transposase RayT
VVICHRKPNRLKNFDYSSSGYYFVTICIKGRQEYFGNIIENKMDLNKFGEIVNKCWFDIPNHFNNVESDEFIIMPNHIHGIIVIKQNIVGVSFMKPEIKMAISKSNHHMGLLNDKKGLINQTPTLGLIIRYFKSKCTYEIHKHGLNNEIWQRNYCEHIIRNEYSLFKIRQYVRNNPKNWGEDRNNMIYH